MIAKYLLLISIWPNWSSNAYCGWWYIHCTWYVCVKQSQSCVFVLLQHSRGFLKNLETKSIWKTRQAKIKPGVKILWKITLIDRSVQKLCHSFSINYSNHVLHFRLVQCVNSYVKLISGVGRLHSKYKIFTALVTLNTWTEKPCWFTQDAIYSR